jgi:hypothetical protein
LKIVLFLEMQPKDHKIPIAVFDNSIELLFLCLAMRLLKIKQCQNNLVFVEARPDIINWLYISFHRAKIPDGVWPL